MKGFSELFHDLDEMTKTGDRISRMVEYFTEASVEDAGWASWFLAGNKVKGAVRTGDLRQWAAQRINLPLWLLEESYERVGDLAETLSLLVRGNEDAQVMNLSRVVEEGLLPLVAADPSEKQQILLGMWDKLRPMDLLPFINCSLVDFVLSILGEPLQSTGRGGQGRTCRDCPAYIRRMGSRSRKFNQIVGEDGLDDAWCHPFPFCLASPLQEKPETLERQKIGGRNGSGTEYDASF